MRSNALKKEDAFAEITSEMTAVKIKAVAPKSWESRRLSIALEAEAACRLPGNHSCPDFEEFLAKYGQASASDFA